MPLINYILWLINPLLLKPGVVGLVHDEVIFSDEGCGLI